MANTIPKDKTGLSVGYRLWWRVKYTVLTFYGPADQSGPRDPRWRLRAERLAKVNAARAERGLEPVEA